MKFKEEYVELLTSANIKIKDLENVFLTNQEGEPPCGYRALWSAVITQALMDAGSNSNKIELRKEKARAISWLNGDSDDFIEVCTRAGLEPGYVKKKAKEAIKNGCKWRMENNPFATKKVEEKVERKVVSMEDYLTTKMLKAS